MSRGHNARRKAKWKQARAAAELGEQKRSVRPRRLVALMPILLIIAVLATAAVMGPGGDSGKSPEQVRQEVDALLVDIPQEGATLGSARAPVTIWIFADLQCPTVRLFAESYLPSILDTWVRRGDVKLTYRSLETDTYNEETFFRQEIAALAAGRQNKMWDFLLTFVHQQGKQASGYATDQFLADIASQVPGLNRAQWRQDRRDALLSRRVALDLRSAHARQLSSTPSFVVKLTTEGSKRLRDGSARETLRGEVEVSLRKHAESLTKEAFDDAPSVSR